MSDKRYCDAPDIEAKFLNHTIKIVWRNEWECWPWQGCVDKKGYGRFSRHGRAYRVSYEFFVGRIPDGLSIDHLCRVPSCVNPDHLEPVTLAENARRAALGTGRKRDHCKYGHLYTTENTYITREGHRFCRQCACARSRKSYNRDYEREKKRRQAARRRQARASAPE
jgi:hypothetical protein